MDFADNYIHIPKAINNVVGNGFMHGWSCSYSIIVWEFNACGDKSGCEVLEVVMVKLKDTHTLFTPIKLQKKEENECYKETRITSFKELRAPNPPMIPKMPRMFGAKMTSKLMRVRRVTAIAMWRGHQKVLFGKNSCWMALLTWEKTSKGKALKSDTEILPAIWSWIL